MTPPLAPSPAQPEFDSRRLLRQTLWVWFFTMLATRGLFELQRIPFFRQNLMLFTGILLIYVPVLVLRKPGNRIDFFEKSFGQLLKSLGWVLLVSAIVFPLIELGNRFFQDWAFHRHYVGGNYRGLGKAFLYHFLLVGIPEEFFYRGYMQTQLNRVWGRNWRLLGVAVGKALPITAFLFALSHSMIMLQWWHFAIFFPGLLFGWFRERTGAITAGALFHALCNVYSFWVALNYR
ncbi:MAG TPA: type II CAAX endopeptidase family protein [bacterium]|nr:type II CAAX endopeptidase family protein [bacterium]